MAVRPRSRHNGTGSNPRPCRSPRHPALSHDSLSFSKADTAHDVRLRQVLHDHNLSRIWPGTGPLPAISSETLYSVVSKVMFVEVLYG